VKGLKSKARGIGLRQGLYMATSVQVLLGELVVHPCLPLSLCAPQSLATPLHLPTMWNTGSAKQLVPSLSRGVHLEMAQH